MFYKKIVFQEPWKISVEEDEVDFSQMPANHILLKKKYSLISAGTELACLAGSEGWFKMPKVPGYCSVSEIAAVGEGVSDFKVGDIVYSSGNHSGYQICSATDLILKVPSDIDLKLIPFTRMATIAMTALRVSKIEIGDYVAVTGQGLVGNLALQLAKLQGAAVIAIDLSDKRLELSKKCGADYILNPSVTDVRQRIMDITCGEGVSTLIEASGVPKVLADNLQVIATSGEAILLGSPRGEFNLNLTELLNRTHICAYDVNLKGAHEFKHPIKKHKFVKHSIERNAKIVFRLLKEEKIQIDGLLSEVVKPEDAVRAYENLKNNKEDYIGVLIDWT